jgi:hypothetical protein
MYALVARPVPPLFLQALITGLSETSEKLPIGLLQVRHIDAEVPLQQGVDIPSNRHCISYSLWWFWSTS